MSTDTVQSPFTMQDASMALLDSLHIANSAVAAADAMDEELQCTPAYGLFNALRLLLGQLEDTIGPAQESAFNAIPRTSGTPVAEVAPPATLAAAERVVLAEGVRELAQKLALMHRLLKEGAETDLELTLEGLVQNAGGLADSLLCSVGEFSKTNQGDAGQWLLSPALAEAIDTARDHGARRLAHAGA